MKSTIVTHRGCVANCNFCSIVYHQGKEIQNRSVDSVVKDLIMPVVGRIFGGLDFANYFVVLGPIPDTFKGDPASYTALKEAGVAVLGWGQFVTVLINFLILAFIIFLLVRWANRLMRRAAVTS